MTTRKPQYQVTTKDEATETILLGSGDQLTARHVQPDVRAALTPDIICALHWYAQHWT